MCEGVGGAWDEGGSAQGWRITDIHTHKQMAYSYSPLRGLNDNRGGVQSLVFRGKKGRGCISLRGVACFVLRRHGGCGGDIDT